MKAWLEDIAAGLRNGVSIPVRIAFPDADLPEEPPVITVGLGNAHLRPAGLGDGLAQLAEAVFVISLYAGTAEACIRDSAALPGLLPGLTLHKQGAVFDADTRWFVTRFEMTRRVLWPLETPPEEELLRIDWKGEIAHEFNP